MRTCLFRSKQLIKDAISNNDFMKTLVTTQVREVIASMYEKEIARGQYIIKEGEAGQHLYVSSGELSGLALSLFLDDNIINYLLCILYGLSRLSVCPAVRLSG